jgi:hypothetical protein
VCSDSGKAKEMVVFETFVRITFVSEDYVVLKSFFKDFTAISTRVIEISLFFEDVDKFKEYCAYKADETRRKWASCAGPDGDLEL